MKSYGFTAMVIATLAVLAAGSAHAQAEPLFGTRAAVACGAPVRSQPNTKEIEAQIRCNTETKTNDRITLVEDIKVESGGLRAYNQFSDGYATSIDTSAKVMPIRGSLTRYQCNQLSKFSKVHTTYDVDNTNKNCLVVKQPKAEGKCYKTTFGDWWCNMQQLVATEDYLMNQPPPK
jgi:NAD-dependent SIR2 family protein deacetylase